MKLLILSDSHNNKKNLDKIIPIINDNIDLIVHAGDNFKDSIYLNQITGVSVCAVCGNCDWENKEEEIIFDVEGVRIFLTHGHRYGVKYNLDELARIAREKKADIVFFGHTHIKEHKKIGGVELINPGSLSQPRDGIEKSYIIMDIKDRVYDYKYVLF